MSEDPQDPPIDVSSLLGDVVRVVLAGEHPRCDYVAQRLGDSYWGECSKAPEGFVVFKERVRMVLRSAAYRGALLDAKKDTMAYIRAEALRKSTMALDTIVGLADRGNDDKRTRTSNAQFLVSAGAGLSPSTKVEPGEDLIALAQKIFGGGTPKADDGPAE